MTTEPSDPYQSEEYQRFVADMVQYCRCRSDNRPCDGVLAGGLCDMIQEDPYYDSPYDDDE